MEINLENSGKDEIAHFILANDQSEAGNYYNESTFE